MKNLKKLRFFARGLSIVFIIFLSLFTLDVFSEYQKLPELILALFMHLIPSLILLTALAVAWKKELWGGLIFIVLGLFSIYFFNTYENLISFLLISMPSILVGGIFVYISQKQKATCPEC